MLKKILISALILIILFSAVVWADEVDEENLENIQEIIETASNSTEEINILSRYAIAFDRTSKTILWGKNENTEVPMASTTKILTSIILIENYRNDLSEEIEVCKEAGSIGGSRLGLKKGDKITINDLLYGLMLCSGNDCAVQIATTVAGNVENFVKLMNKKAKNLGLTHSHFTTPHGLDNPNHYTTAYELAKISDYALNIPKIAEVVSCKNYTVTINGNSKNITNTNELLGYLNGVNGVKTGFTNGAGRCLVSSVSRDNLNIIVVVLGADTKKIRTMDSIKIINYIYDNYELVNIEEKIIEEYKKWKRENEKKIIVNKGKEEYLRTKLGCTKYKSYPIKKENISNVSIEIKNIFNFEAPVRKDENVGKINVYIGGNKLEEIDILNNKEIKKNKIMDYMKMFCFFYNNMV